ncbi:5-carboxymethyl-2-hydroxymuconate Delta-isomerase [Bacillus safensis]|uniref:5-carboxymethyl-2-hydroxymuconate Delta-isomerase n=1 Tax=Bacillus safensis TaxID=561879 RepID=UPI000B449E47|nr:5-carboxymethyl-2-hydroxymuconate Delta-isomerase [Bacillus safensis]MCY7493669.1 5-carboxymethyl-2-hydroxymuconate Delta-isomerase [Bacillus safensis]MED4993112.1 5-carboxymethyl-2-hydroxymuconate Delta-isomerase [Bacillus safensis]UDB46003.1 5-carboxymethyl-2-hydroxymuconate Delta-isomerase [Bacillus safensis]
MPHFIIEYSDNIKAEAEMPYLLKKINDVLISCNNIFPIGGIRSRTIEVHDYYIADGEEDDAFVHATLKIGSGRSKKEKKEVCDKLFQVMKDHFADMYSKRYLALSMELIEFSDGMNYKHNNIHSRFKK